MEGERPLGSSVGRWIEESTLPRGATGVTPYSRVSPSPLGSLSWETRSEKSYGLVSRSGVPSGKEYPGGLGGGPRVHPRVLHDLVSVTLPRGPTGRTVEGWSWDSGRALFRERTAVYKSHPQTQVPRTPSDPGHENSP